MPGLADLLALERGMAMRPVGGELLVKGHCLHGAYSAVVLQIVVHESLHHLLKFGEGLRGCVQVQEQAERVDFLLRSCQIRDALLGQLGVRDVCPGVVALVELSGHDGHSVDSNCVSIVHLHLISHIVGMCREEDDQYEKV